MVTTTILTGTTLTKPSVSTVPNLGILGFGGDYHITLGLYSTPSLGGVPLSTDGLLANTILTGKLLTKPE